MEVNNMEIKKIDFSEYLHKKEDYIQNLNNIDININFNNNNIINTNTIKNNIIKNIYCNICKKKLNNKNYKELIEMAWDLSFCVKCRKKYSYILDIDSWDSDKIPFECMKMEILNKIKKINSS